MSKRVHTNDSADKAAGTQATEGRAAGGRRPSVRNANAPGSGARRSSAQIADAQSSTPKRRLGARPAKSDSPADSADAAKVAEAAEATEASGGAETSEAADGKKHKSRFGGFRWPGKRAEKKGEPEAGDDTAQTPDDATHEPGKQEGKAGAEQVADAQPDDAQGDDQASAEKGADALDEQKVDTSDENGAEARAARRRAVEQPPKKRMWLRVLIAVVAVLLVASLVFTAVFAWNRWGRFDDAADIQGSWYPAGSMAQVTITSDSIAFDEKTAYGYTIDDHVKTIHYTLANLEGEGHYWFTDDRSTLVIFDGHDFTALGTAQEDLARDTVRFIAHTFGNDAPLPEGDTVTVLKREPDEAALAAKAEAERLAAEEQAAEEERQKQEAIEAAQAEQSAEWTDEEPPKEELTNESPSIIERPTNARESSSS